MAAKMGDIELFGGPSAPSAPLKPKSTEKEKKVALSGSTKFPGDEASRPWSTYVDQLHEHKLIKRLTPQENFCQGIRHFDNNLAARDYEQTFCPCGVTAVQQGQVGLATKYGGTYFLPPGSHWFLGCGVSFLRTQAIGIDESRSKENLDYQYADLSSDADPRRRNELKAELHRFQNWHEQHDGVDNPNFFKHQDVTYLNLSDSQVAVIGVGKKQLILDAGRYLLRSPAHVYGVVNIKRLPIPAFVDRINEDAVASPQRTRDNKQQLRPDQVETKNQLVGTHGKCGAVEFVRTQPGTCYVIQSITGQLRVGVGLTIARGGDRFLGFIDRQPQSRTTRVFVVMSKDNHEVHIRVQLKWVLVNAKRWMRRKGASEDIFDALEEVAQSLIRDAIAGQTYEQCRDAEGSGYDDFESLVYQPLRLQADLLGGQLQDFQIRSLRFPLLAERDRARNRQDALAVEKIEDAKKTLMVQTERRRLEISKLINRQQLEIKEMETQLRQLAVRDQQELAKLEAKASLERNKQNREMEIATQRLETEVRQQLLQFEQEQARVVAKLKRAKIVAESHCKELLESARSQSAAQMAESEAEAYAKLSYAQAEAKAATLIGSAYKDNTAFMKLQVAKLNSDVASKRAQALAQAQMLPANLQAELSTFTSLNETLQ